MSHEPLRMRPAHPPGQLPKPRRAGLFTPVLFGHWFTCSRIVEGRFLHPLSSLDFPAYPMKHGVGQRLNSQVKQPEQGEPVLKREPAAPNRVRDEIEHPQRAPEDRDKGDVTEKSRSESEGHRGPIERDQKADCRWRGTSVAGDSTEDPSREQRAYESRESNERAADDGGEDHCLLMHFGSLRESSLRYTTA